MWYSESGTYAPSSRRRPRAAATPHPKQASLPLPGSRWGSMILKPFGSKYEAKKGEGCRWWRRRRRMRGMEGRRD